MHFVSSIEFWLLCEAAWTVPVSAWTVSRHRRRKDRRYREPPRRLASCVIRSASRSWSRSSPSRRSRSRPSRSPRWRRRHGARSGRSSTGSTASSTRWAARTSPSPTRSWPGCTGFPEPSSSPMTSRAGPTAASDPGLLTGAPALESIAASKQDRPASLSDAPGLSSRRPGPSRGPDRLAIRADLARPCWSSIPKRAGARPGGSRPRCR